MASQRAAERKKCDVEFLKRPQKQPRGQEITASDTAMGNLVVVDAQGCLAKGMACAVSASGSRDEYLCSRKCVPPSAGRIHSACTSWLLPSFSTFF